MKKAIKKTDKLILIFDSHLIPRFKPDIADKQDALTIKVNPNNCASRVGLPPSSTNQVAPLILKRPDANCDTP